MVTRCYVLPRHGPHFSQSSTCQVRQAVPNPYGERTACSAMRRPECALLLQLAFFLAAVCSGAAIRCHRSLCLDDANMTACAFNHVTELVNCSDLGDDFSDEENATACVKYSLTGAAYRRISGEAFSPCGSVEVKTCFEYSSNATLDLSGRLREAMHYAGGVNETVLNIHLCHSDACNAAAESGWSTTALLASVLGAVASRLVRR